MSMKVLDEFYKLLVYRRAMPFIHHAIYSIRLDVYSAAYYLIIFKFVLFLLRNKYCFIVVAFSRS
jgi:hypothetical protein